MNFMTLEDANELWLVFPPIFLPSNFILMMMRYGEMIVFSRTLINSFFSHYFVLNFSTFELFGSKIN